MKKKSNIKDKATERGPNHKIGRPTKYRKEYCEKLIAHMKRGLSFESFGAVAGVWKEALYNWVKKHKEFANAKRLGTSFSMMWWEGVGNAGATGTLTRIKKKTVHPDGREDLEYEPSQFNASAYIFNMKNRFGWRDKREVEADITIPTALVKFITPKDE